MDLPIIEAIELKKHFKARKGLLHAVDNINFKIYEGKTLGAVGESGCGKTTLGRAVIRLVEPTAGDVLFKGESILGLNRYKLKRVRNKMSMIFQDPFSSLNPRQNVADLIADPLYINKTHKTRRERDEHVHRLMDTVGLARRVEHSYPHELDGGRRQRIGVARALALNPEFIVCDEPVSALDVSIQAQILNLLMDLQDEMGLTFLFISHDLSVVRHISDEIMVMYLGHCVEKAPCDDIFENPKHPYTKALLSAIPVPSIESRNRRLEVLKGEVGNPVNPKPGCRFAPRCELCTENCTGEDIPLTEISPDHFVACCNLE